MGSLLIGMPLLPTNLQFSSNNASSSVARPGIFTFFDIGKLPFHNSVECGLEKARRLFPPLTESLQKGDCGRVGVIGGSLQYTGAPYFASITTIRMGADLGYLFCHPEAALVVKSYSPELMVTPSQEFNVIEAPLSRLHTLVFGPGLGRESERLIPLMKDLLNFISKMPSLCLVIDADGLNVLCDCINELKDLKNQVILTPNHREFDRLYNRVFPHSTTNNGDDDVDRVKVLAQTLNVVILRKSETDIITDGGKTYFGAVPGSMRRCGGLGDILSGATALFSYWAKLKECKANGLAITSPYKTQHLLDGAHAASDFVRFTAAQTFQRIGRSMTAGDVIAGIPDVVRHYIDSMK